MLWRTIVLFPIFHLIQDLIGYIGEIQPIFTSCYMTAALVFFCLQESCCYVAILSMKEGSTFRKNLGASWPLSFHFCQKLCSRKNRIQYTKGLLILHVTSKKSSISYRKSILNTTEIVIVINCFICMTASFYSIAKACIWQSKHRTNSTNNNLGKFS